MLSTEAGDAADPAYRNHVVQALGRNYHLDGCGVAIGSSTSRIEMDVASGSVNFGPDTLSVPGQTVTLSANTSQYPRVDTIAINDRADAVVIEGTPQQPASSFEYDPVQDAYVRVYDGNDDGTQGSVWPKVIQPSPRDLAGQPLVPLATVWTPGGTNASSQFQNHYKRDRRVSGKALSNVDFWQGVSPQAVVDNAQEGTTLRGDKSDPLVLTDTLLIDTKGVTVRDLTVQLADGVNDDAIRVTADDVSLDNIEIRGNRANQGTDAQGDPIVCDGIEMTASQGTAENIYGEQLTGNVVRVRSRKNDPNSRNNTLRTIIGENNDRDVVCVDGQTAFDTSIDGAWGRNSADRGTLRIRDGPRDVVAETVYGSGQDYVVRLEDHQFDTPYDTSQAFEDVAISDLRAYQVQRLVSTDLRPLGHEDLTVKEGTGSGWQPITTTPAAVVNLKNIDTATIQTLRVTGPPDGQCFRADNCGNIWMSDNVFGDTTGTRSIARIADTNGVQAFFNRFRGGGGEGLTVISASDGGGGVEYIIVGNRATRNVGNDIRITDNANNTGSLDWFICALNLAGVVDRTDTTNKIVNMNLERTDV